MPAQRTIALDQAIDAIMDKKSTEEKEIRRRIIEERYPPPRAPAAATAAVWSSLSAGLFGVSLVWFCVVFDVFLGVLGMTFHTRV